jgi:hypothetical protein
MVGSSGLTAQVTLLLERRRFFFFRFALVFVQLWSSCASGCFATQSISAWTSRPS